MNMKTYVCKKIKLYDYLTNKGHIPYRVTTDIFDPKRKVWLYNDTLKLQKDIASYYCNKS